jgi:hypothetical protein
MVAAADVCASANDPGHALLYAEANVRLCVLRVVFHLLQHLHDEGDCAPDHPYSSRIQHILGEWGQGRMGRGLVSLHLPRWLSSGSRALLLFRRAALPVDQAFQ